MSNPKNVIVTISVLRGYIARWAVQLSPYDTGPDNLDKVLTEVTRRFNASPFLERLAKPYHHTPFIQLLSRRSVLHPWLQALLDMPEVVAWNQRKNGRDGHGVTSRFDAPPEPDDAFIDLDALVQNIASSLLVDSLDCDCKSNRLMSART